MKGSKIRIILSFLLLALIEIVLGIERQRPIHDGFKQERINDKFILTSTSMFDQMKLFNLNELKGCLRVDIHVPESFDPLPLCLNLKTTKHMMAGFHKDFRLVVSPKNKELKKVLTLDNILDQNRAVEGSVIGMGLSYVNGYLRNNAFFGTLAYTHYIRKKSIICSILPLNLLSEFIDLSQMDDDEKEEFIYKRTINSHKGIVANAIVCCGDMHRDDDDDVQDPFNFLESNNNPTNVKRNPKKNRPKRNNPTSVSDLNGTTAPLPVFAPAPLPPSNDPNEPNPTPLSKEELKANKTANKVLTKFMKPDKHGTYFASVCYIVDANYLNRRFNGTAEEATLLLGGFVEITDWVLRSTDWNNDGIPDNIGVRLLEVSIDFITRELKGSDDKWGRSENGIFLKRSEAFGIIREIGRHMNADCDIRSGIGELNVAKYVLHEFGGCTACKHNLLTSFINPYAEKFSPRGEQLRLLYHQIRLLTFGLVHTKGYCTNCTGNINMGMKDSSVAGSIENGDMDWGACIIEGDIQSRSNIPLNSFRLSVCSVENGISCLKELVGRNNCMQFEPEESYCGNGIVEGDEECDCGTLATCVEQQCTCSPRSGIDPCRKLSEEKSKLCFTLIRCRGFRFLYELGQANGTNFISSFNTFTSDPDLRLSTGDRNKDEFTSDTQQIYWSYNIAFGMFFPNAMIVIQYLWM